ncbi:MAG: hypothetical protein JXA81_14925 [Sedimentisphaerales bacterium]|nr:hypothetical protein [Sedimentisphaerales bacterium]
MRKSLCLLLVISLFTSGCATIVTGKYQDISVSSDPPGATVKSGEGSTITTPGSFQLLRNKDYTLAASYPEKAPIQQKLKHELQGWFWMNILLGGIPGMVIDLATGSACELKPKQVHFDFTKQS